MPSYAIVGASRGLGYEWLRQLSHNSENTVIGLARTTPPVEDQLRQDGIKNVHILHADMADNASLVTAASATAEITAGGSLDYLIVNGAYANSTTAFLTPSAFSGKEDLLRKDMIASLDVNVLGVVYSINAFLPLLRKGSVKKIVVISSGLGDLDFTLTSGNSTFLTYSAMKAALNMVVAKYSQELKLEGFVVLALSPGLVNTQTSPPTPEQLEGLQGMMKTFLKAAPDFKGPISPEESVKAQYGVITAATYDDTGAFLSHFGNKKWL